MEDEEKFSDDPIEHLKIENEFLRLKLKTQYGDNFQMFNDGEALPPEVENKFLKQLISFESEIENIKVLSIRERIENPSFQLPEEIDEKDFESKINEVLDKLGDYNINFQFEYPITDYKEVYTFLVTEFMDLKIEHLPMDNMVSHFIYEEFRPNHKAEITITLDDFVKNCIAMQDEDLLMLFTSEYKNEIGETDDNKLKNFFSLFSKLELMECVYDNLDSINKHYDYDEEITITGNIAYKAILENHEHTVIKGNFNFNLIYQGIWRIKKMQFPGLTN